MIPQDKHGRPLPGYEASHFPYHYPTRMLARDELETIKKDLGYIDHYVQHYRPLFVIDEYHGRYLDTLSAMYKHIGETMLSIEERGHLTDKMTAAQQLPLLLADTERYAKEVRVFSKFRKDHPDETSAIPDNVGLHWRQNHAHLAEIQQEVHRLLLSISP